MLAMDEVLSEIHGEERNQQGLPPGFRFHPTDEELVTFYLASKVFNGSFCGVDIAEVDLNRCEPWELPEMAKMGEREWYFFSLRDRKYPTGLRTNRATEAGYWKATGKDKEIYSGSGGGTLLGMKKTLVFYKGRAPRGEKTKWVMHEYRLDGDFSYRHTCKEEWVICRIYHKVGGDKKTQAHNHLIEASSSPSTCLPPLLESNNTTILESQSSIQQTLQNSYLVNQENDLNTLINAGGVYQPHQLWPITTEAPFSVPTNTNPLPSILIKSFLSHQECSLQETATVPKQWQQETNFSYFEPIDFNLHWVDKIHHQNLWQNPLFFEMGCGVLGTSSATTVVGDTTVHDMSTSVRSGFQRMLDPSIRGGSGGEKTGPFDSTN